jgi:hypothetical protein
MSFFAILGVTLAIIAGLINFVTGLLRRKHTMMMLMRIAISILSFIAAAAIIVFKTDNQTLASYGVSGTSKYIYLFMALAIFVGVTLMLPATVERNNLPAEDRFTPSSRTPRAAATGSLAGTGGVTNADGGVHVAKEDDKWVN